MWTVDPPPKKKLKTVVRRYRFGDGACPKYMVLYQVPSSTELGSKGLHDPALHACLCFELACRRTHRLRLLCACRIQLLWQRRLSTVWGLYRESLRLSGARCTSNSSLLRIPNYIMLLHSSSDDDRDVAVDLPSYACFLIAFSHWLPPSATRPPAAARPCHARLTQDPSAPQPNSASEGF